MGKIVKALVLLVTCWCLVGCNGQQPDYSKLGLVDVGGTITLDGQPLAGAGVFFYDEQERCSVAVTDDQGRYQLMFDSRKSGVTPGKKRVEIWTTKNPWGDAAVPGSEAAGEADIEEDPDARPEKSARREKVPDCYNKNSVLTVEITSGDSSLDFHLKSDCSTRSSE